MPSIREPNSRKSETSCCWSNPINKIDLQGKRAGAGAFLIPEIHLKSFPEKNRWTYLWSRDDRSGKNRLEFFRFILGLI